MKQVFGAAPNPPKMVASSVGEKANCEVFGSSSASLTLASIPTANVFLYPKKDTAEEKATQIKGGTNIPKTDVTGLGKGAVFLDFLQTGSVDFTAGSYFVEVYGAPSLRSHLFALAREIYAKLG